MEIAKRISWVNLKRLRWLLIIAVGLLFVGWLFNTPSGLLGKADAIGYAVCHRIDVRSFHIGDRQVPLCARCTGMFLGAILGLGFQFVIGSRRSGSPPITVIVVLGFLTLGFIIDGLNSYLSLLPVFQPLYPPNNVFRLLTGTGVGLAIAAALFPAFNQSVWKVQDSRPGLHGLRSLFILIFLAVSMDLIILTENPIFLYPFAIISAVGVVVLLTMVYTIILLMAFKKESQFDSIKDLIIPIIAGFGVALIQLILLDMVRYWLTGTWEGFHLG
jgi:uncharacterized membrane protein